VTQRRPFMAPSPRAAHIALPLAFTALVGACAAERVAPPGADAAAVDAGSTDARAPGDTPDAAATPDSDAPRADVAEAGDSAPPEADAASDAPEAPAPPAVGWCVLQHPAALSARPASEAGVVFGRVWVAGMTDVPRDGVTGLEALEGELGWGLEGTLPDAAWTWVKGVNARQVDANHEFEATLAAPGTEGTFRYAWRFRASAEAAWTTCDLDGSENGFTPEAAGQLTVSAPRTAWCRIQYPTDELLMTAGETTERLYGRVYAEGLTGDGRRGAVTDVTSEVGFGPRGSTPDGSWTWVAGDFNVVVDNGVDGARTNDEHVGTLTVATPGTYAWAWRFRVAPDGPWRLCDLAGGDPVDPAALPQLTVVNAPR
jgi:hypothetical protein